MKTLFGPKICFFVSITALLACGSKKQSGGAAGDQSSFGGDDSEGGEGGTSSSEGGTSQGASSGKSGNAGTSTAGTSAAAGGQSLGAGGSTPAGCTAIAPTSFQAAGTPGWLTATVTPAGDSTVYTVRIELNEVKGFAQSDGTFDLSKEADYGSADHAVVAWQGGDDIDSAAEVYFQKSGSMTLTTVMSPVTPESKGTLSAVSLGQVTIDPTTFDSTEITGGDCLYISMARWDSTVATGTSCQTAADCGDTSSKICDPGSGTCKTSECNGTTVLCPNSGLCVIQSTEGSAGACYASCVAFSGAECAGNSECVNVLFDESQGLCKTRGTASEGASCTISDVSTECAAGLICSVEEEGNLCRAQCDYWKTSSCKSGQQCDLGSVCSDSPIDSAAIDGMCDGSSADETPCGFDGMAVHAICVSETDDAMNVVMCRKTCRLSVTSDCTAPEVCNPFYQSVGVCQPPM